MIHFQINRTTATEHVLTNLLLLVLKGQEHQTHYCSSCSLDFLKISPQAPGLRVQLITSCIIFAWVEFES